MNMLADAVLPEADDEFSYREDPRNEDRPSRPDRALRLALTAERYRHPLIPVTGTYTDTSAFLRNPVIPLPPPIGYRPDRFETADSAPLPKRGAPKSDAPLVLCPVCRVALIVRKTVCVWCSTHGGAS